MLLPPIPYVASVLNAGGVLHYSLARYLHPTTLNQEVKLLHIFLAFQAHNSTLLPVQLLDLGQD